MQSKCVRKSLLEPEQTMSLEGKANECFDAEIADAEFHASLERAIDFAAADATGVTAKVLGSQVCGSGVCNHQDDGRSILPPCNRMDFQSAKTPENAS